LKPPSFEDGRVFEMTSTDEADRARELTKRGVELLRAGRLCEGTSCFEQALLLDAKYEPARAWLSNAEHKQRVKRVSHAANCYCGTIERIREQERRQLEAERAARRTRLLAELSQVVVSDFLSVDGFLKSHRDTVLIRQNELDDLKSSFVQQWVSDQLGYSIDRQQAEAISATTGDIQVIARAGSGKTRTLITRALFLQRHCRVSPRELLLLAFNKRAAEEMRARLEKALRTDLPHVMTFHALAYALVHPEEDLLFDDGASGEARQSREVQDVIDEHIRSPELASEVQELMLAHFRDDWERIVDGRFQLTIDEFLAFRRQLPRESLKGEYIKSFGEKIIANALFENGIEYQYERNVRWNGTNYRPDFTIPLGTNGGVVIEYFGLDGDPDYDEMSAKKRAFWASRDGWTLLEFTPSDLTSLGAGAFVSRLLRQLAALGAVARRRSEEEIWELVRGRALDGFTSSMRTFIGRCRKKNLTAHALSDLAERHSSVSNAERLFLQVGIKIYGAYLKQLSSRNREDFDGLMWRAADSVRSGQTRFSRDKGREQGDLSRLRFILVDEFQDFSQMFYDLMMAIRVRDPQVRFFCVGDDWQAINAFAGSELRFFNNFDQHFAGASTSRHIATNYRSARSIVDAGNAVMRDRGIPAEAAPQALSGTVLICKLDQFDPSAAELERHDGDEITPAVLRLVWHFVRHGMDVVLLSRRNGLPWFVRQKRADVRTDGLSRFVEHIRSYLPEDERGRVTSATVHGFKGSEQQAVVVLDAVERSFPLIHPNWIFQRVFGDRINGLEEEERRLFYVAVTRASDSLVLVTEGSRQSPYLPSVIRLPNAKTLSWSEFMPVPSLDGARVEIRVFGGFDVKDQLRDLQFRWNGVGKYWQKSTPAEAFSFQALVSQPWVRDGVGIEVYSETGALLHQRRGGRSQ
jgi:DNA helicase-4